MKDITELEVNDFIKEGKVVIDFWMERCSNCKEYASIFEEASRKFEDVKFAKLFFDRDSKEGSEFKRKYLKADKGEKVTFPVTFFFENGQLKRKTYGLLTAQQLDQFVLGETIQDTPEQARKKLLYDLFAQRGELTYNLEILSNKLNKVNEKIQEITTNR